MKKVVKTTKDIRGLFPELPRTDRFKRAVDKWLPNVGGELSIEVAEDGRCYRHSQSGNFYKARLIYGNMQHLTKKGYKQFGGIQYANLSWAYIAKGIGSLIKDSVTYTHICTKCNGTGKIPQFMWYADGVCFECMGVGKRIELTGRNITS